MKYSSCWYIVLASLSSLILFPVSVVICNHIIASFMKLLNWLWCLSEFYLIVFFGNIVWWSECYNYICFCNFYYYKSKTFCRSFYNIYNLYISLYRYDVTEYIYLGEHVVVWSSILLCIANMDGNCLDVGDLVFK